MFSSSRRQRAGDLSSGSTGIFLTPIGSGNGTPFVITAAQLGLVTIEAIIDVHMASENPPVANVTVMYQLAGTSTGIGGTITSSAGTTVALQAYALGY